MEEFILKVNHAINEKRGRLIEKTESYFATIQIPLNLGQDNKQMVSPQTPLVSKLLYGATGALVIGAVTNFTESYFSKGALLLTAVGSAWGGYSLAAHVKAKGKLHKQPHSQSVFAIKNIIMAKVVDIVKKISQEWIDFISLQQKSIRLSVQCSNWAEERKENFLNRISVYEVVEVKLINISSVIDDVQDMSQLQSAISKCKQLLIDGLNRTIDKQLDKLSEF